MAAAWSPSRSDWFKIGGRWAGRSPVLNQAHARVVARRLPVPWRERLISRLLRDWSFIQGEGRAQHHNRAALAWHEFEQSIGAFDGVRVRPTGTTIFGDWRGVHAGTDDDQLYRMAERCSKYCREFGALLALGGIAIRDFVNAWGVKLHAKCKRDDGALMARAIRDAWWRRQLRVIRDRCVERAAMALRWVGGGADKYVSDMSRVNVARRDARSMRMMEDTRLVDSGSGESITLADAWRSSVSNPENRLNEVVTRIKGHQDCGDSLGHVAVFVTMTCPSRFHAVLFRGGSNQHWDGSTPLEAQLYLRKWWEQSRKRLHDAGIDCHGMRVAEPHHDGCPHWHLLCWMREKDREAFESVLTREALRDVGYHGEILAHRIKFEAIDRERGDAVGYVLKYLVKNIPVKIKHESSMILLVPTDKQEIVKKQSLASVRTNKQLEQTAKKHCDERPSVWARVWGVRQFQFFGSAPVTLWRMCRKLKLDELSEVARSVIEQFHHIGDVPANFAVFMREAGSWGVGAPVLGLEMKREATDGVNQYGEPLQDVAIGVDTSIGESYRVIRKRWVALRGATWTRFNNCPAGRAAFRGSGGPVRSTTQGESWPT